MNFSFFKAILMVISISSATFLNGCVPYYPYRSGYQYSSAYYPSYPTYQSNFAYSYGGGSGGRHDHHHGYNSSHDYYPSQPSFSPNNAGGPPIMPHRNHRFR